jgi:hypothetical protein
MAASKRFRDTLNFPTISRERYAKAWALPIRSEHLTSHAATLVFR